jgi:hypothetical protein
LFTNNRWKFRLKGVNLPLPILSCFMQSPYFFLYEIANDCLDCFVGDYWFISIYCDNQEDYKKVWQIGYEIISLFNGTCLLLEPKFHKIEISELFDGEIGQRDCENELSANFLEKPDTLDEIVIAELSRTNINIRLRLLNKATEDEGVYLILKYFEMKPNWDVYYKILESVETLSTKENITMSIDRGKRTRFTNTANNYSLSGIYSRHGVKKNKKENQTPSMEISEAHNFIRDIAKQYLRKKIDPCR